MNAKHLQWIAFFTLLTTCNFSIAEKLDANTIAALEKQLTKNEKRYGTVAQSILVKKQGEIIYNRAHGLSSIELSTTISDENQYPVYSLAKLFTSVALMSLVEKGDVDLDKSITFYIPELPKNWSHVSVRHCLNHTSGIPEYFSMAFIKTEFPDTTYDAINRISKHPFQFSTGDSYNYNNTNFLIIGLIIERLTNESFTTYVENTIIKPLNLKRTFYARAKDKIPSLVNSYWGQQGQYSIDKGVNWASYSFTHSGLYSNKWDLQRFIDGIIEGKILSTNTVYDMWIPMRLNDGTVGRYASGWHYTQEGEFTRVGHEGGNRARLDYHFKPNNRAENYTSIYLTNGNGFGGISTHLVDSLMSIIAPKDFPTLVLLEKLLNDTFNNVIQRTGKNIVNLIDENKFVTRQNRNSFMMERGWTIFYNSSVEHAITYFKFYTEHNPSDEIGWVYLAKSWLKKGDKENALKYFKVALALQKDLPNVQNKVDELQNSKS